MKKHIFTIMYSLSTLASVATTSAYSANGFDVYGFFGCMILFGLLATVPVMAYGLADGINPKHQ